MRRDIQKSTKIIIKIRVELNNMEIWKPIKGYEGVYEVSSFGNVRSLGMNVISNNSRTGYQFKKGKLLKQFYNRRYKTVTLCWIGRKTITVHTLVLESFVSDRPDNMEACHNDGNPENNNLSNLRWGTHKENSSDKIVHGTFQRGSKTSNAKLTESNVAKIKMMIRCMVPLTEIAKIYGVTPTNIGSIKKEKIWLHVV